MKKHNLLIALSGALLAITAMAAGDHVGGHTQGHGDDQIGKPGVAAKVTRTVNVDMSDAMRFTPSSIAVKQGETIRFVVKNSGQIKHELVLGTEKELKEHYELMKKFPDMEHDDANMVTVAPGKTGTVIWQFTQAGKVDFACLQPGHYDAGMKGQVTVAGKKSGPIAAADMTSAEVRKVDKENKKITLKHGDIKNLDMPGMTMVFQVNDPALLDKVKAGDKVRFRAEKSGGAIVVTEIQLVQ